jgi:hypothetical protein
VRRQREDRPAAHVVPQPYVSFAVQWTEGLSKRAGQPCSGTSSGESVNVVPYMPKPVRECQQSKEVTMATSAQREQTNVSARREGTSGAARHGNGSWKRPRLLKIREGSLLVQVVGHGYPLLLMHGGPVGDHTTMWPFRWCADRFAVIL